MGIEGGLVYPFRVNVENQGVAQGFEEMNADAAGFGARRLQEQSQFFAELLLFPRDWFETNKGMQRQGGPPAEYSLRTGYGDAGVMERRGSQRSGGNSASRLSPSSCGRIV